MTSNSLAHIPHSPAPGKSSSMARVREVNRRNKNLHNQHPPHEDDEDYEDVTDGELTDSEHGNETLSQRMAALKEMIPYGMRMRLSLWSSRLFSRMQMLVKVAGNLAWIFTTSMLLVGLPLLYAYDREKNMQEQMMPLPAPASINSK